ncbi:hypothetical protein EG68_12103, partial [Paragonimus skrjabini miyazakii]
HNSKLICSRNYLHCDLQSYLGTTRQIASVGYSTERGTLNDAPSQTTLCKITAKSFEDAFARISRRDLEIIEKSYPAQPFERT